MSRRHSPPVLFSREHALEAVALAEKRRDPDLMIYALQILGMAR